MEIIFHGIVKHLTNGMRREISGNATIPSPPFYGYERLHILINFSLLVLILNGLILF